jgi:hypothetical protein
MLTHFADLGATSADVSSEAALSHVLRLHANESFPLCQQVGLVCLPLDLPVAHQLHDGAVGRTDVVPVIGFREVAQRVELRRFEVLWEAHSRAPGAP